EFPELYDRQPPRYHAQGLGLFRFLDLVVPLHDFDLRRHGGQVRARVPTLQHGGGGGGAGFGEPPHHGFGHRRNQRQFREYIGQFGASLRKSYHGQRGGGANVHEHELHRFSGGGDDHVGQHRCDGGG